MRAWLAILLFSAAGVGAADPRAALKLRVTDNFTHVPLTSAEVWLRQGEQALSKIGTFSNGFFSMPLPEATTGHQFELRADGYAPFLSKRFLQTTNLPLFDIEMDRQFDFEGEIVAPTGQVAAGALYFLCTDPTEVTFRRDRTFFTRSRPPAEAGPKGRFRLTPELTAHMIVVAHDLGYAQVPLAGFTNGARIQLQPWGRVAGQMRINGAIAAKERIALTAAATALGRTKLTFLDFSVVTDEHGRFAFDNVPPVDVLLGWQMGAFGGPINSHQRQLHAGANRDVIYELSGRNIAGSFTFDISKDLNVVAVVATLSTKAGQVPLELWKAGSGIYSTDLRPVYALVSKPDLTFHATAIPPGEYLLQTQIYSRQVSRLDFQARFTVPPGAGPLDLGAIQLTRSFP